MHQRLPFPKGGCHPPWFPPHHRRYHHHHERQRTRPSSEQLRFVGLGRSMQCYHGNQTRRPPPLPTVHSTVGLRDPRSKMQRYFDNGNYPRQGHVPAPVSPWSPVAFFIQTLHPLAREKELTFLFLPRYIPSRYVICHTCTIVWNYVFYILLPTIEAYMFKDRC